MNLRNSQQDTGTGSKGSHQVTGHGKTTNASSTESSSGRNDTLQFLVHTLLSVASHDESLVLELLCDIPWARSGHLNPSLGEHGTGNKHIRDVNSSVERIEESVGEVQWRRHVVGDTGGSKKLSRSILWLPNAKESDKQVVGEARVEHLADEENVRGQSGLQHNRHVGGIEEADWV